MINLKLSQASGYNNYIIIYLAPTWGRPFTSATDFSSCQKCGRTEAPQLFPPFSFDQAQDFLIWVLQVTTSFDSIHSIIQHYTALTCCNAWHILTNILIMLDISWYFCLQDILFSERNILKKQSCRSSYPGSLKGLCDLRPNSCLCLTSQQIE